MKFGKMTVLAALMALFCDGSTQPAMADDGIVGTWTVVGDEMKNLHTFRGDGTCLWEAVIVNEEGSGKDTVGLAMEGTYTYSGDTLSRMDTVQRWDMDLDGTSDSTLNGEWPTVSVTKFLTSDRFIACETAYTNCDTLERTER